MKLRRVISWIALNALVVALAWNGIYNQVAWSANVLKFLLWSNLCFAILGFLSAATDSNVRRRFKRKGLSVPDEVELAFDVLCGSILAAVGWFGYAAIVLATGLLQINTFSGDKESA